MEIVTQVNTTTDYSMFKTLNGNRSVNKLHVKRLKISFQESYLLSPIIVNERYEVIDGQHRLAAAKEINKPVNFIICKGYGLKEVQLLNTNMKNWKKIDYLNAYCDLKSPNYLIFRNFMREFNVFGLAACESLLTNRASAGTSSRIDRNLRSETNIAGHYTIRYFQEGNLEIPDYSVSVENAKKILLIKPYFEGFNRRAFVNAMISIFKLDYYDHEKLIERLKANPAAMQACSNVTQYRIMIEDIYNFRSRNKVSLRF